MLSCKTWCKSTFRQIASLAYCHIKANESMFNKTVFVAMNSNLLYHFSKMYLADVANLNSNYMISTTNIFAIFISFLILSLAEQCYNIQRAILMIYDNIFTFDIL